VREKVYNGTSVFMRLGKPLVFGAIEIAATLPKHLSGGTGSVE
jgi:hypothetical protein